VHFHLYRNFWVLASAGKDENGITVDLPPVRIIPQKDLATLQKTIEALLEEPLRQGVQLPSDDVGLRARAVGAKSWPAFVRSARSFDLELSPLGLTIEEWRRQGRSFVAADPVWRTKCKPEELDQALERLLQHVENS
jgi:hypothetical protein